MFKITLNIEGMGCGMCEAHINDAVRRAFSVKKVTSSHAKGLTEIVAENEIAEAELKTTIESAGYSVTGYKCEPFKKVGFSLFKK